ncbi:hypothetical protein DFH08DRAFT_810266 [Mycena albidolilacea]|uniref:Zn(2)-C6 fungal-type domain-containing protein n=1 Tax=Mycena albidolilacea TaxID=1033008 RepID=A0AAD6ZXR9_9AGAR|nr:hypothetical protein DFH08DRAFT_810266 [Mycena albidolilacea]
MPPRTRSSGTQRSSARDLASSPMTKGKNRLKKKASSPTSTAAEDALPKCLVPGRNMLSTEPGALTWLHFDNHECRQFCRLFDATEVAQMEDRMIMAIAREAAPYFRDFRDRFPDTTAEIEMFLWSVVAAATPLSQCFPSAFSIDPSIEPTEDNPYPIDEFYCTPLLWVRPTGEHRALVRSTYGANATAFNSDFQIPHVVPVPTVYSLPDSDDEEEADRKVADAEEAAGDESGSELGVLRPGSSARLTHKTQPAPSSTTKAEGSSKSVSASTSKPGGTIHVKKEGAASVKTPATPTAQNRPVPKPAYCGTPSSTAAHFLPSKAGRKCPQVEIHTQGRPPSVETERPEQKPPKRGRDPDTTSSRKAAKAHAAALPPAGEREIDPATHLEVVPHDAVAELTDGSLPDENTIACGTCAARGRTCERNSLNSACDYCARGGQVCTFTRSPEGFHQILESLRPLMDLSGGALASVVMSAAQARRDMVQQYAMLARAAHNFDRLCTEVVVLFNHQSSVLPLSHLEQMFEDPEDIQMLRALSDRAAEASSRKALEAAYRHERAVTTSGPDSNGLTYYARHNRDSTARPSQVSALRGSEHLSSHIFANATGASLSDIDRVPSPDNESLVPKPEPGTSSVQGTSHVRFEQPPIATMSVASNSPPPSPDGLPSGNPVAPHTPVVSRQPTIRQFFTLTPAHKRVPGGVQPMEGVVGGEGSHAASG